MEKHVGNAKSVGTHHLTFKLHYRFINGSIIANKKYTDIFIHAKSYNEIQVNYWRVRYLKNCRTINNC